MSNWPLGQKNPDLLVGPMVRMPNILPCWHSTYAWAWEMKITGIFISILWSRQGRCFREGKAKMCAYPMYLLLPPTPCTWIQMCPVCCWTWRPRGPHSASPHRRQILNISRCRNPFLGPRSCRHTLLPVSYTKNVHGWIIKFCPEQNLPLLQNL